MYTKYFEYIHPPFPRSNSSDSHFPSRGRSQLHVLSLLKIKSISPSRLSAANTHVADDRLMLNNAQLTSQRLVLPSSHQIPSSFLAGVGVSCISPLAVFLGLIFYKHYIVLKIVSVNLWSWNQHFLIFFFFSVLC